MTRICMRFQLRVPPFALADHATHYRACLEMSTWAERVGVEQSPSVNTTATPPASSRHNWRRLPPCSDVLNDCGWPYWCSPRSMIRFVSPSSWPRSTALAPGRLEVDPSVPEG